MPQYENLPSQPQVELAGPATVMPEHIAGYAPLGQETVIADEERIEQEMEADWHEKQMDIDGEWDIEAAETLVDSPYRARVVGRLAMIKDTAEKYFVGSLGYEPTVHDAYYHAAHAHNEARNSRIERDKGLDQIRKHLEEIDVYERDVTVNGRVYPSRLRQKLNHYLTTELPTVLQDDYQTWEARIGRHFPDRTTDRVAWLSKTGDAQLLNFLQWHNDRTEKMNADPAFQQRVADKKAALKASIKADVMDPDKPLTMDALLALPKIDDLRVVAGDIFDTVMTNTLGYYMHGSRQIVVGEDFDDETFRHEVNHATLGRMRNRLMNEAMTEHLTLAGENGDYKTMNPDQRSDKGTYLAFRRTNAKVLTAGLNPDLLDLQIACYLEGDNGGPRARLFRHELNKSYGGVDVMKFLNAQVVRGEQHARKKHLGRDHDVIAEEGADYAGRGITILGLLAKGYRAEDLRATWAADQSRDNSEWLRHLDEVASYVNYDRQRQQPRTRLRGPHRAR